MHLLRSAYGYTDPQILEHISTYGQAWVDEAINNINQDKQEEMEWGVQMLRWAIWIAPIARTPMSTQGSHSLNRYEKQLLKVLDEMLPWKLEEKKEKIRKRLKEPPKSQMRVIE